MTISNTEPENWLAQRVAASRDSFRQLENAGLGAKIAQSRDGKTITLSDGQKIVEFASCCYLGFETDQRLVEAAKRSLDCWSTQLACARTRIVTHEVLELEGLLSQILGGMSVTVFQSASLAHIGVLPLFASGVLPSFPMRSPRFILDRKAHASIQVLRAVLESFGAVMMVDIGDLEAVKSNLQSIRRAGDTPVVICDGIGSMGHIAPIEQILLMLEEVDGFLYCDDAHGFSVIGEHGQGHAMTHLRRCPHRGIVVVSLNKSFGTNGGAVAVPTEGDLDLIRRYATSYAFSGSPALALVSASTESARIHLSEELGERQRLFRDNLAVLDLELDGIGYPLINQHSASPVRGIVLAEEDACIKFCSSILRQGFLLTTALYPTVERNAATARIAVSASHSRDEIVGLCRTIRDVASRSI
ncbi:MAG: aminotransferase class I/II-fold pyridoxal phosphate-dependent enzyme [Planctomycetales bacterium]|nr:aminotransferase class I/II-fold pyridoxal phosphate-dependent enzyme [Planctomycetales bacterium]